MGRSVYCSAVKSDCFTKHTSQLHSHQYTPASTLLYPIQQLEAKRDLRKSGPPSTSNFECQICHRMCRSRIGLLAHNKSHSWWWDPSYRRLSPWLFRVFLWHNGISYFLKHIVACGYQKWISLHNHTQSQWSICIEPLTKLDSGNT